MKYNYGLKLTHFVSHRCCKLIFTQYFNFLFTNLSIDENFYPFFVFFICQSDMKIENFDLTIFS